MARKLPLRKVKKIHKIFIPYCFSVSQQWLQLFTITQQAMIKINIAMVDSNALAECTIKLSFVLSCISNTKDFKVVRATSPAESTRSHNNNESVCKKHLR